MVVTIRRERMATGRDAADLRSSGPPLSYLGNGRNQPFELLWEEAERFQSIMGLDVRN